MNKKYVLLKLRNTELLIGKLENTNNLNYYISNTMQISLVEMGDYNGLILSPWIPFGLNLIIPLNKNDIMFISEPPSVLLENYVHRLEDSVRFDKEYEDKLKEQQEDYKKHLN